MADVTKLYINIYKFAPPLGFGSGGNKVLCYADITWGVNTNTYPTGGIAVTAQDLQISALSAIDVWLHEEGMMEGSTARDGHICLDRANSKLTIVVAAGTAASGDVGAWKGRVMYVATEP